MTQEKHSPSRNLTLRPTKEDVNQRRDKLLSIDQKIQQLRQKRERLQIHQALFFTKEAQKILKEDFSPEMALVVLEKTWETASESQKKEWQMHSPSFRFSPKPHRQKTQQRHSIPAQNGIPETHSHECL